MDPPDVLEPSSQLLFAPHDEFPFFKDYAVTYNLNELMYFTPSDLDKVIPTGFYPRTSDFSYKQNLHIKGPLTIRIGVKFTGRHLRTSTLVSQGAGGDTEGANFPYMMQWLRYNYMYFLSEYSNGQDMEFNSTYLPDLIGMDVLFELRRDASRNITLYANGVNILFLVNPVDGVVNNEDGSVTANFEPTGGEATLFMTSALSETWVSARSIQLEFIHIFNSTELNETPQEAATRLGYSFPNTFLNLAKISPTELVSMSNDPSALAVIVATPTGIEDLVGNAESFAITGTINTRPVFYAGEYWMDDGTGTAVYDGVNNGMFRGIGLDATVECVIRRQRTWSGSIVNIGNSGIGIANNSQFALSFNQSSINYTHHTGNKQTRNVIFDWPAYPWNVGEFFAIRVTRKDDGGGRVLIRGYIKTWWDEKWRQLSIQSVNSTGVVVNGVDAYQDAPDGGDNALLNIGFGTAHQTKYLAIYNECKTDDIESHPLLKSHFITTPKSLVGKWPMSWRSYSPRSRDLSNITPNSEAYNVHPMEKTDRGVFLGNYDNSYFNAVMKLDEMLETNNSLPFSLGIKVTMTEEDFKTPRNGYFCSFLTSAPLTTSGRGIVFAVRDDGGTKVLQFLMRAYASGTTLYNLEANFDTYVPGTETTIAITSDGTTARLWVDGVEVDFTIVATEAGNHRYAATLGSNAGVALFRGYIRGFLYDDSEHTATQIDEWLSISTD